MMKRVISFLLAVVLLVGAVPVGALATETESTVSDNGMIIEGSNAVGSLLAQEIQAEMSEEEVYEPGFSVTALEFSGATATVTYDALEKASLVVAIYSEDGLTLLNNAYTTVYPEATEATVTISGEMPEYFYAAAYLVDTYDMSPLCPDYSTPMYTKAMQDLLVSTVADYDADRVLNLDSNNSTNFLVYAPRLNQIESNGGSNTVESIDDDAMVYVLGNVDEQITKLLPGDVLFYEYAEEQYLITKVKTLELDGTTATITGMEVELGEVFSHVKIEGDSDDAVYTYDDSTLGDGLTRTERSTFSGRNVEGSHRFAETFSLFEVGGDGASVSGTLTFAMDVSVKYYAVEGVHFLEFRDDASITFDAKFEGSYEKTKPLGKIGVKFIGGAIFVGMEPKVMLKAEAEAQFTATVTAALGAKLESGKGASSLNETPKVTYDLRVEGSVYLGLDLGPTLEVLGGFLVDGDIKLAFGYRVEGELTGDITHGSIGGEPEEPEDVLHTCQACIALDGYSQVNFQMSAQFLKLDFLTVSSQDYQFDTHLGSWYYSVDHNEFDEGQCPYEEYRVSVEVLDYYGQPVSGALVTATGEISISETTNANGIASIYLPLCQYNIRAEIDNLRRTVSTGVLQPRTLTITLPEPPEDPEETVPDEVIPEVTEPAFPGGILGDIESTPVVNAGKPVFTGVFGENNNLKWEFYHDLTLKISGKGEVTDDPWDDYSYGGPDYDYDSGGKYGWNLNVVIDHVIMEEGITGFGTVFQNMDWTEKVTLPSTVTRIENNAFNSSSSLREINIPSGVTYIGEYAFQHCPKLKEITLPGSVQEIGRNAFGYCGLEKVTIEEGITELPEGIFFACQKLKEVELPSTLKKIGWHAFYYSSLRNIEIPDGMEEIGYYAFMGTPLTKITIPSSVKNLTGATFEDCTNLVSVTLNEGLEFIGNDTFSGCTALTSITIPKSVYWIYSRAFSKCTNLREINFVDGRGPGWLDSRGLYIMEGAFFNCTSLTRLEFPARLYELNANAFAGCTGLQEVVFKYGTPYLDNTSHYLDPDSGIYDYEGVYAEIFPGVTAKAYYPWIYCEDAGEEKIFHYGSDSWSKESMKNLGSQITWIPYTVDEEGNMIPDESKAYCANPPAEEEEIIDQEPANGLVPTEPVETEPVVTEPVETEPVVTEPVVIEPVETEPVETEPVETQAVETEPVETVAQTEPAETGPQFLTLEEAAELKVPTSASAIMPETAETVISVPAAENQSESGLILPDRIPDYTLPPKPEFIPEPPAEVLDAEQVIGKPSYDAIFGGDYSSEEREEYILKTASFSGLVPGEEYLLLAVKSLSGDPMSMSNLIHIDQGRASSGGTLKFDYVEREKFAVSYVMACGASNKNLNDAVITVPTMYASEGEQIVKPKVKYDGKTLKQGTDYTLTGDVAFNTAGEHVCYIRGIYEYTGLVKCTYTVLEKPLPRILIEGVDAIEGGTTATLTAEFTFDPDPDTVVTWSLAEGDEAYATLTPNGNSVAVKASLVEEYTYITLLAEAPGKAEPATHELTIYPRYTPDVLTEKIDIYQSVWEEGEEVWYLVSGKYEPTIWVDGETESSVTLNIDTYPMGADRYVYWESSDPEVAVLEQDYGQNNTVTFTGKPGDVTIYAYAADGSDVTASATYHAKLPMAVEPAVDSDIHLLAGKSTTLKIRNADTKKAIKSGNIQWELDAGEKDATAYATINKSGKLTANKIGEQASLTVYGRVYDKGEYVTSVPFTVTIYPAVTQAELLLDGEVVNGRTVSCDPTNQESMVLSLKAYPDDVRDVPVKWSISDQKKQQYASYEIRYDEETGENSLVITPKAEIRKVGTVTIKATTDEGSKKSASVKVQFGIFADQVDITAEDGKTSLTSKEKLNLSAVVTPDNVTKPGVTWSLSKEDKAYASLSGKGNAAVLTAKTVYTEQEITVIATSKDGAAVGEYPVTIKPENILVIRDAEKKNVTKTTISVDLNQPEAERSITLSAGNFLDEETVAVKWKPAKSSSSAQVVSNEDGTLSVTMLKKGSLTVTAEAQDGSKRKATVTIKAANLAQSVGITTKDGKNVAMGEDNIPVISLASGKSVNLKAVVENASSSKVSWRAVMLNADGEEVDAARYAKISSSGKLSATKDLTSVKEVWVYAVPADGGNAAGKTKVVIRPLAQGVQIYTEDKTTGQMLMMADSGDTGVFGIARAATTMVWDMHPETNKTMQLSAKVYPYYEDMPSRNALQSVTWSSSKPKVATVDTNGKITFLQAGTTNITATAADGSNKKVSFRLEVVKIMETLKLPETAFIAGGKKLTLVPQITPVDTTWPHLAWHVSDSTGRNDVKISSKGVLTTPKVTEPREVFVQAMSTDGSDLWTYCDVTIYPATKKITLWDGDEVVKKLSMAPGETAKLAVTCEPELAAGVYQWTSSNTAYAAVDQNGMVTIPDDAANGKKVTITCMAADGTKVKASVSITIDKE